MNKPTYSLSEIERKWGSLDNFLQESSARRDEQAKDAQQSQRGMSDKARQRLNVLFYGGGEQTMSA